MLISNTHKFIFIHLYKCAGTSIERAFIPTLRWNDLLLGSTRTGEKLSDIFYGLHGLRKHSSALDVKRVVGDEVWANYYTFSTVRNPFALALSQYSFSLQHLLIAQRQLNSRYLLEGTFSIQSNLFSQWPYNYPGVRALLESGGINATFSQFIRSRHLQGWAGLTSQSDQLCDEHGKLLVKEIIKVEDLPQRWSSLITRLALPELPLENFNCSTDGSIPLSSVFASQDDLEFIRQLYWKDFDTFNYSLDI